MPNARNNKEMNSNSNTNSSRGKYAERRPGRDKTGSKAKASVPARNDYTFYAVNDAIAKDIASLPFNYLGGTAFNLGGQAAPYSINEHAPAIPSVMALEYVNSIGVTNSQTQGVNMAAVQLYTLIRHVNSGARNYEAADVMMYVLAMRDIYATYFEIRKILGLASAFNVLNHNLPNMLIYAHYIDPIDMRQNIAQYRGQLNLLAEKINSFAVPKYFKIFERTAYVNSYIFGDSNSVRGQFYTYVKMVDYMWSGTTSTSGTELTATVRPVIQASTATPNPAYRKLSDLIAILEQQLDSLFLDEDAITMSGDILKAFPEAELYKVVSTDMNYITPIVMDENSLAQIENSITLLPFGGGLDMSGISNLNLDIEQSNQIITFNPSYTLSRPTGSLAPRPHKYVLNSHKDSPDYKDVLEWTRLMTMCAFESSGENAFKVSVTTTGLEIISSYRVWFYLYSVASTGVTTLTGVRSHAFGSMIENTTADPATAQIVLMNAFDWHPVLYCTGAGIVPGANLKIPVVATGDFKVATLVESSTIDKINDAAVYGALYASNKY